MITCSSSDITEYQVHTVCRQCFKKFFLGLELPNEVSLASKRPLVTPKRCGSHKNDRDAPWSSRPSSVFFVPGGILPVRSHVEGGSSARSLHRRRYHLGLRIKWISRENGCAQDSLCAIFRGASHNTARFTDPIRSTAGTIAIWWNRPQIYGLDSQGAAREQKRTSLGTNIVRVRKRA